VIADTGHNESGITEVIKQINLTAHNHLHFVLGMVNDKDISKVLSLLPKRATYYFCKASIPRALAAEKLSEQAHEFGLYGRVYHSVSDAYQAARSTAKSNDLVFIGGSTFTVAEVV
jgi:dihydrofolate synthase/folylpolyglutamate synthase